jgi:hypothetical protein
MAILTISGSPASRFEEVAHGCSQLLGFELVTESRLSQWMAEEFGDTPIPNRAWRPAAVSILARMAAEHHLIICLWGAQALFPSSPFTLRAGILAPDARRLGNVSWTASMTGSQGSLATHGSRGRICTNCVWSAHGCNLIPSMDAEREHLMPPNVGHPASVGKAQIVASRFAGVGDSGQAI